MDKFNVKIGFRGSSTTINPIIKLNESFFWILGILIAEASITKNPIEFTLGRDEYSRHKKLNNDLENVFGVRVKSYQPKNRNVYLSKVNNEGFFYFINNILDIKGKALTKNVPNIVLNTLLKNKISFLHGYWEGDGWKKSNYNFSVSTNSYELADELMYLCLMVGIVPRCHKKNNLNGLGGPSYCIENNDIIHPKEINKKNIEKKIDIIPGVGELLYNMHKELGIKTRVDKIYHTKLYNKLMRWKMGLNQPTRLNIKKVMKEFSKYGKVSGTILIDKLINSDLSFLRINNLKKINYKYDYVYDLGIKNYENFLGGFGGIILHNSHFARNIGMYEHLTILDRHILKNLHKHGVIQEIPNPLNKKQYLEIEEKMKKFAYEIGIPIEEMDLLFWSEETGEIFK